MATKKSPKQTKRLALTSTTRANIRKSGIVFLRQHEPAAKNAEPCADGLIDQGVLKAFAEAAGVDRLDPVTTATTIEQIEALRRRDERRQSSMGPWEHYAEALEGVVREIGKVLQVDASGLTSETLPAIAQRIMSALAYDASTMPLTRQAMRNMLEIPVPDHPQDMAWTDIIEATRKLVKADKQARETRTLTKALTEGDAWIDAANHEQLKLERDALRKALIETGRNVGAYLADNVSTEFLMHVPEEAKAALKKAEGVSKDGIGEHTYTKLKVALGFADKYPSIEALITKATEAHRDVSIRIPALEESQQKAIKNANKLETELAEQKSIVKSACHAVHATLQALNIGLHTQTDLDFMGSALLTDGVKHIVEAKVAFTKLLNAGPHTPLWQLAEMATNHVSCESLRRQNIMRAEANKQLTAECERLRKQRAETICVLQDLVENPHVRQAPDAVFGTVVTLIRSLGAEPLKGVPETKLEADIPPIEEFETVKLGNYGGPTKALRDEIEPLLMQSFRKLGSHQALLSMLVYALAECCRREGMDVTAVELVEALDRAH
jgi:hypothetical protein